jgi:hypothetical protein
MSTLKRVATNARRWLQATAPSRATGSLRNLGLWLCDRIQEPALGGIMDIPGGSVKLPAPTAIVDMSRREVLSLMQVIALSGPSTYPGRTVDRGTWARILGGTALSYARVGDVVAVASLVRAAARLRLSGAWLTDAQRYLVDQQQPDGSFGLLAPELTVMHETRQTDLALRLTAEVLWALAEVATFESPMLQSASHRTVGLARPISGSRVRHRGEPPVPGEQWARDTLLPDRPTRRQLRRKRS